MGKFTFTQTEIPGVVVIEPQVFGDDRGYFMETYQTVSYTHLGDIILRDGVFQHAGIHGRRNELGALCSQHCGGEHIIGDAVGLSLIHI